MNTPDFLYDSTQRTTCIISKEPIHSLYTFKKFPILMSTVTGGSKETDIFKDMEWGYSDAGHIQLINIIDPLLIYTNYHNPGTIGKIWKDHHKRFAEFIQQDKFQNVLEIGGASGSLVNNFMSVEKPFKWTIVEPSPEGLQDYRINLITGYFEEHKFDEKFDTIVHSHCFEHVYDPIKFLNKIYNLLNYGDCHYISIPNMKSWLENGSSNALNFEHTFYVDSKVMRYLLSKTGFKVVDEISNPHSVFIKAIKEKNQNIENIDFSYIKALFENYIEATKKDVDLINCQINDNKYYLFGGHIFAQSLLNMGLSENNIICIIDNDHKKQGKRLYGTNLIVHSANCLSNESNPIVVVRCGPYSEEIKSSLLNVNPTIKFI